MDKLRIACNKNEGNFYNLYQLTIEKIRRFYHAINGLSKINTSIEDRTLDKQILLNNLENFYLYVKNGINLQEGKFKIKSRNIK